MRHSGDRGCWGAGVDLCRCVRWVVAGWSTNQTNRNYLRWATPEWVVPDLCILTSAITSQKDNERSTAWLVAQHQRYLLPYHHPGGEHSQTFIFTDMQTRASKRLHSLILSYSLSLYHQPSSNLFILHLPHLFFYNGIILLVHFFHIISIHLRLYAVASLRFAALSLSLLLNSLARLHNYTLFYIHLLSYSFYSGTFVRVSWV